MAIPMGIANSNVQQDKSPLYEKIIFIKVPKFRLGASRLNENSSRYLRFSEIQVE